MLIPSILRIRISVGRIQLHRALLDRQALPAH